MTSGEICLAPAEVERNINTVVGNFNKVKAFVCYYVVKMGRFNGVEESIFYTALDPVTAIKEARINSGEDFSLRLYDLTANDYADLLTVNIVPSKIIPQITGNQRLHAMILSDFIYTEVTRPVGVGTEYQYKASCAIAKMLLDIPNKDSLFYPSMID